MKQIFFTLFIMAGLFSVNLTGQIATPAPSPFCQLKQTVGLTEVTIEYSRPGVKGRQIFGGLVPYGEVWRTGANAATKITFSDDVVFGGNALKAGSYAIFTIPGESQWQVHLFPYETGNTGAYGDKEPAAKIMADVAELPFSVENMTFMVMDIRNSSANIGLVWDKTVIGIPLEVHTDKAVMASIESTMAGPNQNDYYAAASYFLSENKDMDKALMWVNKALEMGYDRYWVHRTKSLIQAKLGDKKGAVASAKRSAELAKEAGNNAMVRENEASIKEWMESK